MKFIEQEGIDAGWQNAIMKDLSFIKKKHRFPLNAKTLAPTFLLIVFLIISLGLTLSTIQSGRNIFVTISMVLLVFVAVLSTTVRFFRTLQFQNIPSPYFLADNIKTIEFFLKSQKLAVTQLPDAPEIFCIISRSFSRSGDKREVMFFIACDKKILVNSHFTGSNLVISGASGHSRQMAKRLSNWLRSYSTSGNNSTITSVNTN